MTPRKRPGQPEAKAASWDPAELTQLIDARDALAEAKCIVAATWLACGSPVLDRTTAAALSAVTHIAREQLENVLAMLDALIALVNNRDG